MLAVCTLLLLALVPIRHLNWLNWFGDLTHTVVAPASHPISAVAHWVVPTHMEDIVSGVGEEVLIEELERTRQAMLRMEMENQQLRRLVDDLQRGFSLQSSESVRPLARPVVGNPSDLSGGMLVVRAGSRDGVTTNTVATYDGMQLVGRVERVTSRICEIQPISARHAARLDAVVMLEPNGGAMLPCSLTPVGDGSLAGPVTEPDSAEGQIPLAVGQDVRLRVNDGSWPESSQMLLIGRIVEIAPAPDQPVRRYITVQPLVDLSRISRVVLRVPVDALREDAP